MFWSILILFVLILVIIKIYLKLTSSWCRSQICLTGKTVIVTGANTGIGFETAIDLAKRGARVILACRDQQRAKEACEKIIAETDNQNVIYKLVDFASLASVRKFADDINKTEKRLDILVNNAGAGGLGNKVTEDGLQVGMQVNYFGPTLLTHLLLDLLKKTGSTRIVNVSSIIAKYHRKPLDISNLNVFDDDVHIYGRSKLCNILFTISLAEKLKGSNVTVYSLHPGAVTTEIMRKLPAWALLLYIHVGSLFCKDSREGAQTSIYCAVERNIEKYSGEHFEECHVVSRYKTVQDPDLARRLWEATVKILNLEKTS